MPADTKRIVGPDETVPYRLYSGREARDKRLGARATSTRPDGRDLAVARPLYADLGSISQAKGSAYVECGRTKVVVAVYEPREIPKQTTFDNQGELYCEVKFAPFSTINRTQLMPSNLERDIATTMRRALEPAVLRHLFANFQIDIFAYVLENDGSCLSALINAAGLALADAEIPLYDSVVAVTFGIQGEHIFVDPTAHEEQLCSSNNNDSGGTDNHGVIVQAVLPEQEQASELWQCGSIPLDVVLKVLDSYTDVYKSIYEHLRTTLSAKIKKHLETHKKVQRKTEHEEENINNLLKSIRDDVHIE